MQEISIQWDKARNERYIEGVPHVFHCHHYNVYLQKTLEDAKIVDGKGIQKNAAQEVAFEQFSKAFSERDDLKDTAERLKFAEQLFKMLGFGTIDFSEIESGKVTCPVSHYAKGWMSKWGNRSRPVDYFVAGWLGGLLSAVYEKPRFHYEVTETQCQAVDGDVCIFKVEVR